VDNAVAFTVLSSLGFTDLLGKLVDKLGVSLEREGIRNMILCEGHSQKNKLKCYIYSLRFVY